MSLDSLWMLARKMTPEETVGQLFCISVGHHSDGAYGFADGMEETTELVRRLHIGGVCYFPVGEQGATPSAIEEATRELQGAAKVPLIISTDQEGGLVTRMREPATRWPSAMALAAGEDWERVGEAARMLGEELRAVGINQTYAPIADVNTEPRNPIIGIRSAGSAPEVVARFDQVVIESFAEVPIGSCLKHFPGHGDTHVDSHVGLPVLETTLKQWEQTEAIPFVAGIRAGADSVMVGHLVAPGLDPSGAPATFSHAIVTGLLRESLGFRGVIVTDALDMAGAHVSGGPGAACVMALKAGVDQLLMPRDPESCVRAVLEAVESGELSLEDLRASAERILRLKDKLGLLSGSLPTRVPVDRLTNRTAAARAIRKGLTWRDGDVTFTLDMDRPLTVVYSPLPPSAGRGVEDVPRQIVEEIEHLGANGRALPLAQMLLERGEASNNAAPDQVILLIRDAWANPDSAEMVRDALASDLYSAVVAARSPYDSVLVPEGLPLLLTFGDIPGVGAEVGRVLAGRQPAGGVLPIDLPRPESMEDTPGAAPSSPVRWPRRLEVSHRD